MTRIHLGALQRVNRSGVRGALLLARSIPGYQLNVWANHGGFVLRTNDWRGRCADSTWEHHTERSQLLVQILRCWNPTKIVLAEPALELATA
jgi:hypothetical protein